MAKLKLTKLYVKGPSDGHGVTVRLDRGVFKNARMVSWSIHYDVHTEYDGGQPYFYYAGRGNVDVTFQTERGVVVSVKGDLVDFRWEK
jgi:hypothetical protein